MTKDNMIENLRERYLFILIVALCFVIGLYILNLYNYLLYHTVVELLGALIAFTIFSIGWYTREYAKNNMLIILAVGYLVVGVMDVLHTIAFPGMGVFQAYETNVATQFWISARFIETATILAASLFLGTEKLLYDKARTLLTVFLITGVFLIILIFRGVFPTCFVEGEGLTTFKILSEYIISAVIIISGIIFWRKRDHLKYDILTLMLVAFGFTVMSELSFTLYEDAYGFFNFLGHVLKFFSISIIYFALVNESLKKPYKLIFKEIEEANKALEEDIEERKKIEQRLKYVSLHDQMTGLYNREFFEEEKRRLSKSREYPITIIVSDVNYLKLINDTMGHEKGDELLKISTKVLKDSFRSSDIIARIGGDEFAVLLPKTDSETALEIINRVRSNIKELNSESEELYLSMSFGTYTAEDFNTSLDEVFKRADDEMYKNKVEVKNQTGYEFINIFKKALARKNCMLDDHTSKVNYLCLEMGKRIGLNSTQLDNLSFLAELYDLGKVNVPNNILNKKTPLNAQEWEIIKQHPIYGYQIANTSPNLTGIAELILKHHERWDGKGYPQGLEGKDIPIECRILAIVDAYLAMTTERPYRKAKNQSDAVEEIKHCSGTQFDPVLVEIFLEVLEEND